MMGRGAEGQSAYKSVGAGDRRVLGVPHTTASTHRALNVLFSHSLSKPASTDYLN